MQETKPSILIRYGEIFLKGNNRYYFESLLNSNIKKALKGIEYNLIKTQSRVYIENFDSSFEQEIIDKLLSVFGIHSISPTVKIKTNIDDIAELAVKMTPDKGSFRVTVNRADKKIMSTSTEISKLVGGLVLTAKPELKVNLFEFDFEINIDIRENGYSYIFTKKLLGQQGLPVGCGGNGMLLLSGGIDSPVAGYLMAKRGVRVHAIHYQSFPYTSELALEKVIDLAKQMSKFCLPIELTIIPFTKIQYAIHEKCPEEFMITIMRRIMMRIAERVAKTKYCGALMTGESLGQVASQTMESILVTNSVVSLPVFRPLIGNDKSEIMDIAKRIDTYNISIKPFEDCCTVFLPKNPVIKPKLKVIEDAESVLDLESLIEEAIANAEIKLCELD